MSTTASISHFNDDGTITTIFCNFDGYINHVGKILFFYYNSHIKIKRLLVNGNMSFLGKRRNPRKYRVHNQINTQKDTTVFYIRDYNESYEKNKPINGNVDIFYNNWRDYNYLYKDGVWYVAKGNKKCNKQNILDIFEPLNLFIK